MSWDAGLNSSNLSLSPWPVLQRRGADVAMDGESEPVSLLFLGFMTVERSARTDRHEC